MNPSWLSGLAVRQARAQVQHSRSSQGTASGNQLAQTLLPVAEVRDRSAQPANETRRQAAASRGRDRTSRRSRSAGRQAGMNLSRPLGTLLGPHPRKPHHPVLGGAVRLLPGSVGRSPSSVARSGPRARRRPTVSRQLRHHWIDPPGAHSCTTTPRSPRASNSSRSAAGVPARIGKVPQWMGATASTPRSSTARAASRGPIV